MAMVTRMATAVGTDMITASLAMDMDSPAMEAMAAGPEWPSYSAASLARAIIMAPLTESWDLRLDEQFAPMSATMDT